MRANIILLVTALFLTIHCRNVSASWGAWSAWSECLGSCTDAHQSRTRSCTGGATGVCIGPDWQSRKCTPLVREEDCARCKLNSANIGYLADCGDVTKYYQCEKINDEEYRLTSMSCRQCTVWSQDQLTCIRDPDDPFCEDSSIPDPGKERIVVYGSTCSKGNLHFGLVAGDSTKYEMYSGGKAYVMPCPLGTRFNLSQCSCVNADLPDSSSDTVAEPMMCLNFEKMTKASKWGFSDDGCWVSNHGKTWNSPHVEVKTNQCVEGKKCAYFSGQSFLSIDSLANTFHTWNTFTISLWHKASNHPGAFGIFTNGLLHGCSSLPSVSMTTQNGHVEGHVTINSGKVDLVGQVRATEWNYVTLTRDHNAIVLYVNGKLVDKKEVKGSLMPSQCPMMFGVGDSENYFQGLMDNICLYKTALTQHQVQEAYLTMAPKSDTEGSTGVVGATGTSEIAGASTGAHIAGATSNTEIAGASSSF